MLIVGLADLSAALFLPKPDTAEKTGDESGGQTHRPRRRSPRCIRGTILMATLRATRRMQQAGVALDRAGCCIAGS